ncbi:penicillin-binding protein 2 [Notoacmeibacter ruber]|uniref:Penicillin-binding protein 2 n=2 Tax=Notoacmeibacter ruber TaxID=2670375 RepID=A0A3L7JG73_9HYPH|nr:penicillin-binding protein 2 [Notoacmeibacter ruber]
MMMTLFVAVYGVMGGRVVQLAVQDSVVTGSIPRVAQMARPEILDRNGQVMATDIRTASLFAEPHRIGDPDEVVEKLRTVLPSLNYEQTRRRLTSSAKYIRLRRDLTPRQQSAIHELGLAGIKFEPEKKRFYPGGPTAAHVLGLTSADGRGIAGLEKWIDSNGLQSLREAGLAEAESLEPVRTSIDLRVQHVLRDALAHAMKRYSCIGAAGVVLDALTGEIVAMSSLPDYDLNDPHDQQAPDRLNRMTSGVYEMGSSFKALTIAMALDSGDVHMGSIVDASQKLRVGRFAIGDFHGKYRPLTVPEVFIFSSNIGTAKLADQAGIDQHRAFLEKMGVMKKMDLELPEIGTPQYPDEWKRINSLTIAFGHGLSTTPLQTASAAAALMNGGHLIPPTLVPRSLDEARKVGTQVIKPETSANMRYLFRLNVEKGSGKRAEVPGYDVGGKTGTAEKVVNGRYSKTKRYNDFLAAFPIRNPRYIVFVTLDEPKAPPEGGGVTAGSNAAPTVGDIILRSAPLLGVEPEFGPENESVLAAD